VLLSKSVDDINDETPTDITLTGNLTIAENTTDNTNLGTLSATDADEGDTFIYTLVNNSAAYSVILRLPVKVMAVGVSSLRLARLTVMVCSAFLSSPSPVVALTLTILLKQTKVTTLSTPSSPKMIMPLSALLKTPVIYSASVALITPS
jgi:hypothetical protein